MYTVALEDSADCDNMHMQGLCFVITCVLICDYCCTVMNICHTYLYISMRLTVTWGPMGIGPQLLP